MSPVPRLGLRANWRQFTLLIVINAFVGAMVGMERVVVPLLAERDFGIASRSVILSFIVSFGLVKAAANLLAGGLSDRAGRRRVLIAGWLFALPIPAMLYLAPAWEWVVAANVLLGINQGLAWSTTVIMKIDLVGPVRRGLAMGLNEAAGYLAVSLAALCSGYLAAVYGHRDALLAVGATAAAAGLILSVAFARESRHHAEAEARTQQPSRATFGEIFARTSWRDRTLFSITQAGLVNNLNDGMAWGLLPLFYTSQGLPLGQVASLSALYPAVWGIAQLATGAWSDCAGRKPLIAAGMWLQGAAIALIPLWRSFSGWALAAVLLGLGTAMVYPTLLAAIGDVAHSSWRASAVGVYRLWRDAGYAIGALLSGLAADALGMEWAIFLVGALTALSGVIAAVRMRETSARARRPAPSAVLPLPASRSAGEA
jgi:MFS family permease